LFFTIPRPAASKAAGSPPVAAIKAEAAEVVRSRMALTFVARFASVAFSAVFKTSTSAWAAPASATLSATGGPVMYLRCSAGSLAMPVATRRQMAICSRTVLFPKPSLKRFMVSQEVWSRTWSILPANRQSR
jgi:hypothetical protein